MKILLTGRNGQVGWELQKSLAPLGELTALGRAELDLRDAARIGEAVRAANPHVIVNAAAYTAVDKAESERDLAFAVNAVAPGILADEAKRSGALLVHYSTDYVFDGTKATPYVEDDAPNPLNVYGASKLAGERAIAASGCRYLIFRTSWVYADRGRNFLLTVLRLAGEGKELRVVDDQHGAPTSSRMIAEALPDAISALSRDSALGGLYHMTAGGSTTWYGFARAIFREKGIATPVAAIPSTQFAALARRPGNSLLDNSRLASKLGILLPSWDAGMRDVLSSMQ